MLKQPLSPALSRLRRAQQALIGRRRRRVSSRNNKVRVSFQRSSSSGLRSSGTRSSIRTAQQKRTAKPRIGLDTPRRRDAGPFPQLGHLEVTTSAASKTTQFRDNEQSHAKRAKPIEEVDESRYSLMQVPEEPGYYSMSTLYPRVRNSNLTDSLQSLHRSASQNTHTWDPLKVKSMGTMQGFRSHIRSHMRKDMRATLLVLLQRTENSAHMQLPTRHRDSLELLVSRSVKCHPRRERDSGCLILMLQNLYGAVYCSKAI